MAEDTNAGKYFYLSSHEIQLTESAAWPVADEALSQQLLDLVQSAGHYRQIKKGANGSYTFLFTPQIQG